MPQLPRSNMSLREGDARAYSTRLERGWVGYQNLDMHSKGPLYLYVMSGVIAVV